MGRRVWHQVWADRHEAGLQPDAVAEDVRELREGGDGWPAELGLPVLPTRRDLNKAWQLCSAYFITVNLISHSKSLAQGSILVLQSSTMLSQSWY